MPVVQPEHYCYFFMAWLAFGVTGSVFSQTTPISFTAPDTSVVSQLKDDLSAVPDTIRLLDGARSLIPDIQLPPVTDEIRFPQIRKGLLTLDGLGTSGSVGIGYEYGLLPFLMQADPPQDNIRADGSVNLSVKNIPLNASFYYSSTGTITGLNNYFHFQYDAERYKRELKEKASLEKLKKLGSLEQLEEEKRKLLEEIHVLDQAGLHPDMKPMGLPSFSVNKVVSFPIDGVSIPEMGLPSIDGLLPDPKELFSDPGDLGVDTTLLKKEKLLGRIQLINAQIDKLQKYRSMNVDSLFEKKDVAQELLPEGMPGFFPYLRKLEIGMCYPSHSYFLASGIPLRGVNVEYQKDQFFIAAAHGKTVNNLYFTNDLIQNNLNKIRNLYNFFDFANVEDGRKITMVKGGYGKPEESHFYGGILYGLGKVSYADDVTSSDKEVNCVVELDGKWKLGKEHALSLVYGRSAIQVTHVNFGDDGKVFNELFNPYERTHAAQLKYEGKMEASGTQVGLGFRYVDPFFRSFGLGSMRSDNMRYDVKVKQRITKAIRLGGFVRHEEDNLLNMYAMQTQLFSYGLTGDVRLGRKLLMKADYRPIVQNVMSENDSLDYSNQNQIFNVLATYKARVKNNYFYLTGIYSYYQLFNGEANHVYQNINLTSTMVVGEKWKHDWIANQFITSDTSSVGEAYVLQYDSSVKTKGLTLTGMLKGAFVQGQEGELGYGLRAGLSLAKGLSIELSGEKLVFGDFYNSLSTQNMEAFPYYCTSTIRFTW